MASASETDNFPNGPAGTIPLSVSNDNNTNASENLKNGLASNSNSSNNKPPVGYPNMSDHNNVANQHSGGPPPDMNNANSQPGYPPPPGREGGGGPGPQNNGHHPMDAGDPKHWGSGPGLGSITPQNSNVANPGGYDTMPYAYNRPYEPSSYMHAMPSHNNVPDIANSFPFSQYSPQAPRSPYGPVASKPMAYLNTNPRPGPGAGPPSMSSSYAPGYPPHHQPRYMGGPPAPHPPTPTLNQLLQNQRYPGPPPPGHHPPPPPSSNAYSSGPGPATDYPPKDSWMQHRMPYSQQPMYRPQDVQEPIESTNSGALNATPNLSGRGSPAPNNIAPPLGSSVSTSNSSLPPPPQPSQAQQQSQNSIATPTVVRPAPSPTGSTGSNSRSMSPAIGQGNLPMPPRPSSSQSDSSGQPPRMSQSPMATQSPYQSSMPPPPHMGVYANKMAPGHPGLSPYPPPGQYPPSGSSGAGAYMPRPPSSGYPSGGVPTGYPNQPPMGSPSQGTPSPSPGPPQPQGPGTIVPPSSAQAHPQPGGPYPNRPIQQYPPYPGPPVSQYPPQQGWGVPGPPTGLGSMPPGKGVGPPPPPPSHQQAMMGSVPPTPAQQAPRPHTPPHPYLKQHLQQKIGGYGHPPGPGPGGQPPQPPPHGHPQGQGPPPMMAFSTGMLSPNMASHGQHPPAASSPGMGVGPVTSLVTTGPDGAALDEASQQSTLSNASAASGDEAPSTPRSRKDNASGPNMPSSMSHGHAPPPPSQSQSHPTTPQSTVPSPGAASMTGSAQEDYADLNSPGNQGNWSRAPVSPVFNHTTGTDPYKHKKSGSGDSLSRLYEFDDNPDRRVFLDRLLRFMEDKGAPITACPTISKNPLDLYRLYHLVRERGGFVEVTKNKAWKDIAGILGIGASSSAAYTLRKHYTKNLLPWECKYDRGGIDPQPIINQVESSTKKKGNKGISVPSPGSSNSQDSFPTGGSSAMDGYYGYSSGEYGTPMMHRGPSQQANMSENVALSNPFEDHQGGGAYSRQAMNNNYPNMYANNMPGRPPGMPSGYGPTPPQGPYYGPGPVNHEYPGQSGPIQGGPPPPSQHPPQQQHPAPPPNAAAPQLSHGPPSGPPAPQQNQAYPPAPGYPPPPRTVYPPYPTQEERMYAPPPGPPPPHPPPTSAPPGSGVGPDPYGRYGGPQYNNAAGPAPGARPPPQAAPSPAPSSSPAPPNAPNPPSQQQQQPQQPPQPPPGLNQALPQPQQSLQPPGHLPQPSSPASRPPASPAPMPPAAASPAPPTVGMPSSAGSQPPPTTLSAANNQIPTSGPGTGNAPAPYPPQDVYQQDPYQRTGLRQLLASPPSQSSGNLMSMNSNNPSASSTVHTSSNKSPLAQQLAGNHNAAQGYPGPIPAPGTPPSQPPFMAIQSPVKGSIPPPAGATPRPPNPQQQPGGQPPPQQPPFAPYGQPRPAYDRGNGSGYMYGAPFNPSEAWRGGSPYGSPQYPPQGSSPGPAPPAGPQPTPPPWAQAAGAPAPPPQASSPARPMQPSQWAEQQQRYQAQQQQQQQSPQTYPLQQGQNTWNVNMGGPMRGQGPRPPFRPDSKGYQMAPSPATKGPMSQMMSSYGVSKPVPMFPLDSIEAITPVLVKRRRLNKSDVAPVDPWRVFLALKSGLLAETTWALDTLNILLFDDSSVAYFGLNYLPGLLEVLLEHFRRTLYDMFGILEDMEWNQAASLLESKKRGGANTTSQNGSGEVWWQRTPVRRRGKVVLAPGEDDSSNPVEEPDSADSDMGQIQAADLVGDKTLVLEQPYAPWSARMHRSIKIVPREDDIFVSDRVKAWDVFEKKTFVVSDLGVDDLSHIRTKFDAELGLVSFVRILRGKTKNRSKAESEADKEETGQDSQSTLGSSSPSSAASNENNIKKPGFSLSTKRNCVKKTRSLADVLSRIKKEPLDGSSSEVLLCASAEEAVVEAIPSKSEELATEMEIEEADQAPREEVGLVSAGLERIRDPHGVLKRRRVEEYEDECLMRDEASLYLYTDTQESLAKRCLCIATILRNLTFVPGNEASFSRNVAFLNLAGKLLLLHHEHPLRSTKQRNYDREDELDYSDSCTSLHEPEWWWDALIVLREHVLVILANISGQLDLSLYPEEIARPILDGLLHYAVCSSAQAQDPLQAYGPYSLSLVSWQRLSLEALCKLCVTEANTDLILATPPFERLEKLVALCGRSICRTEDQVLREFAINVLFYLAAADSGMAHVLAHSGNTLALLVAFIEQAEASALAVASQHGLQALREAPESMGTSLDMLRRAAHILYYVAQHPECRPLVGKLEPRLLALVMSQIMDQGVAAVLARALYLCTASPDNKC